MTEIELIIDRLLESDAGAPVGIEPVVRVFEEEDDETIKDILGADYLEAPEPEGGKTTGEIERFGRWADVRIGSSVFCISYLTPVAVYISGQGLFRSSREWSTTTVRHIVKWAKHNGYIDSGANWDGFKRQAQVMDQGELIELFKRESKRVPWSKRDARKSETFRPPLYWKGDNTDRVKLEPYVERE